MFPTQAEKDFLIVQSIVGKDLERFNNLIIEMQKEYQKVFLKSKEDVENALMEASYFIVHSNTRKNQHTLSAALTHLKKCASYLPIQTNWLFEKIEGDLSKVKNTCDCDMCNTVVGK